MKNTELLVTRDADARENLNQIKKFLDNVPMKKPPRCPQKGFFREGPYLWSAFTYYFEDKQWILTIRENIQHEGYCKKWLGLEAEEI